MALDPILRTDMAHSRGGVGKKILGEQITNHYQASENPLPQKTWFFVLTAYLYTQPVQILSKYN